MGWKVIRIISKIRIFIILIGITTLTRRIHRGFEYFSYRLVSLRTFETAYIEERIIRFTSVSPERNATRPDHASSEPRIIQPGIVSGIGCYRFPIQLNCHRFGI